MLVEHGHRVGPSFGVEDNNTHSSYVDNNDSETSSIEDQDEEDDGPHCTTQNFVTLMTQSLTFHAYYKKQSFWLETQAREGE